MIYTAKIEHADKQTLDDSPGYRFPWWSFTKTVLASCALQLVAKNRLKLDEALPDRPFTLHQLLQHQAGVPNYGALAAYHEAVARADDPWPIEELLERVGADRLVFAPGNGWAYSNVGYLFVRQLIEETMEIDISSAIRELVTAPLGLSSCSLASTPADLDATAWGNPKRYHPGWVYHGLLIGSAMDAARFLSDLMAGRLLSPDLLAAMTTRCPIGGALPGRPWESTGYGLGMMNGSMSRSGRALGHSGGGPGSVCAIYNFPQTPSRCTVTAFTQGDDEGIAEHAVDRLAAD